MWPPSRPAPDLARVAILDSTVVAAPTVQIWVRAGALESAPVPFTIELRSAAAAVELAGVLGGRL